MWPRLHGYGGCFIERGFNEVILPALSEQQIFIDRAGASIVEQMYAFDDKGGRKVCLIPEGTAIVEREYLDSWSKQMPKPIKVFYVARCYRYERPQAGRYREFTQFGVEILGGKDPADREESISVLKDCLAGVDYRMVDKVKRGLNYYVEDGFEAECDCLGAQKQVAGGGRYASGIGFAIGIDRLMLARKMVTVV